MPAQQAAPDVDYRSIVNSMASPLIVVDGGLTVTFANLAAYQMLGTGEEHVLGRPFFTIGMGQWNEPALRPLLEAVIPHDISINAFEIEQEFPEIGRRILNLSARRLLRDGRSTRHCLISIEDVTSEGIEARDTESELDRVNAMIDEIHHRVKNNIASITAMVRLEGRRVEDGRAREAFERIAGRIESLATLYELLAVRDNSGRVELVGYFDRLCQSIQKVAAAAGPGWSIEVFGDRMEVGIDDALAVGAVVHELVANAAKYAFHDRQDIGRITLECICRPGRILLELADNGNGIDPQSSDPQSTGLGMRLVEMYLANLGGEMSRDSDNGGTRYKISLPLDAAVPAQSGGGEAASAAPTKPAAAIAPGSNVSRLAR